MPPKSELHKLFETAHQKKASDLHLLVNKKPILRINGILTEIESSSILSGNDIENLIKGIINEISTSIYLLKQLMKALQEHQPIHEQELRKQQEIAV